MATNANWTVIFDDKKIIKQTGEYSPRAFDIDDDAFWNDSKWSNIWAIQYVSDNLDHMDTVEHRDTTPHKSWNQAELGDFSSQFISRWDAELLKELQLSWDEDSRDESEKGARPTSYSS
tara:strand:+ start:609 stop:965 length:357 start_codon:yes stop_codon:yes gene_type:complete